MFLTPSQYQEATSKKATWEEWLQKSREEKPDDQLAVSSSEEEEKEDEDERAQREELDDDEDVDPLAWSGEEKWPRLNSPPFTCKEEPLVLREDPRVEVPAHIAKYLRLYQREGVQFLYEKYSKGVGGILGDDMGLGKTVQTTAFLIAVLGKKATAEDICTEEELVKRTDRKRPVLIVAPASLLLQWRSELLVWSFFNIHVCTGATKLQTVEKAQKGELEVLITSYETYRVLSGDLNKIDWEVVVFDEAHRIKNPKSRLTETAMLLATKTRFGLTGTLLQNEMKELHCTMNWARPMCLGYYKDFRTMFEKPIKDGQRQNATLHQVGYARDKAEKLKAKIDRHVLRRSKKEIADQVPPKEDWIVICPLSETQMAVYDRLLSHKDIELLRRCEEPCVCGMEDENGDKYTRAKCCFKYIDPEEIDLFIVPPAKEDDEENGVKWCSYMLPAITQICKICNHLDLVRVCRTDKKHKQERDERFARIVFDSDDRRVIEQQDDLRVMSSVRDCGKLQVLQSVLETCYRQRDKVLIFSYSVRMLDILEKFLITKGHKFLRLDGSTPPSKRLKLVDEFNSSEQLFCMIMSTKAGGLGINLTSANVVLVIDPNWNPSHDMQAQDRAYRIGQRRHVKVYRFLSAGTIEEVMYQRQIYKQQLVRISMDASHEKRYYTGVQGDKKNQGELFGVANLLKWKKPDSRTKDILDREGRESREFCLRELQMERIEVKAEPSAGGGGGEDADDDDGDGSTYEKAARVFVEEQVEEEDLLEKEAKKKKAKPQTVQNIFETLSLHTHRHDDVIGESASEAEIHKAAREQHGGRASPGGGGSSRASSSQAAGGQRKGAARGAGSDGGAAADDGWRQTKKPRKDGKAPASGKPKIELLMQRCRETFDMELSEYMEAMESEEMSEEIRVEMRRTLEELQDGLDGTDG